MVRINLLAVRVSKKKEAGKQQLALAAAVLVVALAGNYAWDHARSADLAARQSKLAHTKAEIAQLEKIIGEVKNIKAEQAALKEKLDVLDKLKQGRTGPVKLLDELATLTPKRLWFKKIEEKGGAMVFDGSAATIDDVSALMSALKQSRFFTKVELKKTTARTEGRYKLVDFTLDTACTYTPAAAPGVPAASSGAAAAAAPVAR
ncbi:PilN domain-containing protein [Anaeromyxobacter paludicola]|uniref:Fimbrial protein n=1 Tax=Anaeromyxobacter paludicola TaxID=2918171 RepID=A0ABM7XAY8_9BACT|nr:PilN domain-containing protein [Anaeromyxobacter paludicola]BDG09027.1 fimbrial protein [Anaeromyxobacter paludicola]